jgi:hypothetical protein
MTNIYTVEYEGKTYTIEGDRPPTEEEMPHIVARYARAQRNIPLDKPFSKAVSEAGSSLFKTYTGVSGRAVDAFQSVVAKEKQQAIDTMYNAMIRRGVSDVEAQKAVQQRYGRDSEFYFEALRDPSFGVRVAGEVVAPLVIDPVQEGVKLGINVVKNLTPDTLQRGLGEFIEDKLKNLKNTPAYQAGLEAVDKGIQAWTNYSDQFPEEARDIKAALNLAEIWKPAALRKPIDDTTILGRLGETQSKRAEELETVPALFTDRRAFLNKVITPEDTAANRKERVDRVVQTKRGTNVYVNSADENEMIDILMGVKGVTSKNTNVGNRQAVEQEIDRLRKQLDKDLDNVSFERIDKDALRATFATKIKELKKTSPTLTGDAAKVAQKIIDKVDSLLAATDGSPKSVLDVRRQLDQWAKDQGRDNFDGFENAYTIAMRTVRNTINDAVDLSLRRTFVEKGSSRVKDVDSNLKGLPGDVDPDAPQSFIGAKEVGVNPKFRESLRQQHLLYEVRDRLKEKSVNEANTLVGRIKSNLDKLAVALPTTPLSIGLTVSAAGTLLYKYSPQLFATAGIGSAIGTIGYAAYRGTISPKLRRALSNVLKGIDEGIKKTKVREMRDILAADRVAIIELMKLPTTTASDEAEQDENVVDGFVVAP